MKKAALLLNVIIYPLVWVGAVILAAGLGVQYVRDEVLDDKGY